LTQPKTGFKYKIIRIIEEDISGRGDSLHKRTGLMEAKRAIKNGKIDFFVVEKLDRLSRDKIGNQLFVETANDYGVEVHEVESGLINLRDRGSRLGFNIKNIMAEEYSLDLEEKVTKKQREARFNNGKDVATVPTLGLDMHPTKAGMYVINTSEQRIVEDIFRQFCALGGSLKATQDYCTKKGYRTKVRYTKQKIDREGNIVQPRKIGGKEFNLKRLHYLLTNPKYRGYSHFKDTWNQFAKLQDENGYVKWNYAHGPVIDIELFKQVQALLEQNEIKTFRSPKAVHPDT
jgi:DNA invertase Pin-like site-specific DNA recombinase